MMKMSYDLNRSFSLISIFMNLILFPLVRICALFKYFRGISKKRDKKMKDFLNKNES